MPELSDAGTGTSVVATAQLGPDHPDVREFEGSMDDVRAGRDRTRSGAHSSADDAPRESVTVEASGTVAVPAFLGVLAAALGIGVALFTTITEGLAESEQD